MKRIIIYGFFFACFVGFLMNHKPNPEEQIVAEDFVTNTTMSSIPAQNFFDGHIGSDASEMASRTFLDKFLLRNYYEQNSNHMEFLKSSLVKIANFGYSKAFICSKKLAKELTEDHNGHRLDERARIEASGGKFKFSTNSVPLLNGHFPMTRAIGDVPLKKYGIIAIPEVTDWLNLTSKDEYLVVASDGILESLSPQKVCDFLCEAEDHSDLTLLAQQIVQKAFLEGSKDNLSVVLVPLGTRISCR
ncbi:probable protein phosphatase 2C 51 [Solanum dulcamara]|uniref:probable protein phosphatase 2C 51 n=1 Tax=Solanum dulcamara TaxID=45834 RepID=UPI00248566F7|nr:probable protein phosphatase 2C 51 [Solanum dulcamara]